MKTLPVSQSAVVLPSSVKSPDKILFAVALAYTNGTPMHAVWLSFVEARTALAAERNIRRKAKNNMLNTVAVTVRAVPQKG